MERVIYVDSDSEELPLLEEADFECFSSSLVNRSGVVLPDESSVRSQKETTLKGGISKLKTSKPKQIRPNDLSTLEGRSREFLQMYQSTSGRRAITVTPSTIDTKKVLKRQGRLLNEHRRAIVNEMSQR